MRSMISCCAMDYSASRRSCGTGTMVDKEVQRVGNFAKSGRESAPLLGKFEPATAGGGARQAHRERTGRLSGRPSISPKQEQGAGVIEDRLTGSEQGKIGDNHCGDFDQIASYQSDPSRTVMVPFVTSGRSGLNSASGSAVKCVTPQVGSYAVADFWRGNW